MLVSSCTYLFDAHPLALVCGQCHVFCTLKTWLWKLPSSGSLFHSSRSSTKCIRRVMNHFLQCRILKPTCPLSSRSYFLLTMTHACESLDITLARDVAAKKFSWFILPGRSMAFVKFDSSYVPQAWIPPAKPATGSTEDQSPKLSAFWYPRGVAKLRPTLNPYLQAYFYKIQHIMPRTCHPSVIHHEARLIIHSVSAGLNHSQPKLSGDAVAKALFLVGTARPEYSRTVALLVYDVLVELNLSNWLAMRTLRIHLEDVATSTILKAWSNVCQFVISCTLPKGNGSLYIALGWSYAHASGDWLRGIRPST